VDIGVWMSRETLEDKLALRQDSNPQAAWNLNRWPSGFREGEQNRLLVASEGAWRGYFRLADHVLVNRADPAAAYTLLLDTRTWTPIPPVPATRFRGFTYKVPALPLDEAQQEGVATPADPSTPASRA
jgi:hypothetical protein